jgi:hypothetical protein
VREHPIGGRAALAFVEREHRSRLRRRLSACAGWQRRTMPASERGHLDSPESGRRPAARVAGYGGASAASNQTASRSSASSAARRSATRGLCLREPGLPPGPGNNRVREETAQWVYAVLTSTDLDENTLQAERKRSAPIRIASFEC